MQIRYVLGIALIFSAMATVSIVTYYQNQEAYFSIDQLLAEGGPFEAAGLSAVDAGSDLREASDAGEPLGRRIQIRGIVEPETVDRGDDGLELRFALSGKAGAIPIQYRGIVPDTFDMADSVTVGGYLTDSGVFLAEDLFVQCPSKYEAEPPGAEAAAEVGIDG
jgi:cytochrome c-type biogenesis protein CcmE